MIKTHALSKSFGAQRAVDGLELSILEGEIFGLLGPNGAGKTTTIHMLVGVLAPDAGRIDIAGGADATSSQTRRRIGIAPQRLAIYDELSAEENLAFFARLYGLGASILSERVDWGLEFSGLEERRRDRVSTFSGGMKRRLNFACALVHDPQICFLDEPTVGVDPQSRNHIFDRVESLRGEGRTIVYTTHYMEEAQRLCDRIAIVDHGKLLALGSVEGLIAEHGGASRVRIDLRPATTESEIEEIRETICRDSGGPDSVELESNELRFESSEPFAMIARLGQRGDTIESLHVDRPDLERVFLNLTGRSLRD